MNRAATSKGNLLRLGFLDPEASLAALTELGESGDALLAMLSRSADPDQALASLVRIAQAAVDRDALLRELADDEGTAMRLLLVLGASQALGEHLARHPEHWRELTDPALGSTRPAAFALRADLLRAVGADPAHPAPTATVPDGEAVDALRVEYTGSCCGWRPATWPTTSASTTWPPSCPTWPPAPWRRPWPSPASGSATTPGSPGSRSWRWASAAATS